MCPSYLGGGHVVGDGHWATCHCKGLDQPDSQSFRLFASSTTACVDGPLEPDLVHGAPAGVDGGADCCQHLAMNTAQ